MPDHLLSPTEAIVGGAAAVALIAVAIAKTKKSANSNTLPMMGIMAAFVFAAQMINYTIPGAECSGHVLGGVLLASVLGPWAGFLALSAVVAIQALLFADGGVMALGLNILNMAAIGCLVAYPLVFRKLLAGKRNPVRTILASVVACTIATTLGAGAVVVENGLAGVNALPFGEFLGAMMPTHLAIGAIEGVITGGLLWAIGAANATVLDYNKEKGKVAMHKPVATMLAFALSALLLGFGVSRFASTAPDGLEWSMEQVESQE